ncbi:MAG TPA: adenylate/guanylate cyclase domain-containing protein [Burkholderiales bacterium]|nr:adenylate/guanylate cyclase domain-containing protein [Burkholderiales bacterium]
MSSSEAASSVPAAAARRSWAVAALVLVMLAGLPVAVWLDLRNISEAVLSRQANDIHNMLKSFREYYASHVVDRVISAPGVMTQVVHDYDTIAGAIPNPATLSMELGQMVSARSPNIVYRFASDLPFRSRAPHQLDDLEKMSLAMLRQDPRRYVTRMSKSVLTDSVRVVSPVIMESACVSCHNAHPLSPKHDWRVGDVRGFESVSITQPLVANMYAFKYLFMYFVFTAAVGIGFIVLQRRQARELRSMNEELGRTNDFLHAISTKLSRYLSPQIYKSIFSGEKDVVVHTERKKLTIFFSDLKDFTSTTERLQPEELTRLLNEYFTEMSAIALAHGGTIDKFVGDAMLIFFGDPESRGVAEDAKACVRMALEMQQRMAALNVKWRQEGVERPFRVRMGINTGYCDVGNFGSATRMDYTIIGDEANLAARLQGIADVERIVISYETYALVQDVVSATALPPVTLKGIGREVVPYVVEGVRSRADEAKVVSGQTAGLTLYLDPSKVDGDAKGRVRELLTRALEALEKPPLADQAR